MTIESLLPPASTALERALEQVSALRVDALDAPVDTVWNPATIAAPLLPWLAWGLSIDRWNPDWSEAKKRTAIADAIADQRQKGTPASLRTILNDYEPLLALVEWFDLNPRGIPHTFEIRLPVGDNRTPPERAAMIADVIRDIAMVKPVRSHFRFVQLLDLAQLIRVVAGVNLVDFIRFDAAAMTVPTRNWALVLQAETGEPLQSEDGEFLLDEAA
jgi:phage tail P2-like protein